MRSAHRAWTAAIGEFEALCSLAAFAYERPGAIVSGASGRRRSRASKPPAMQHPLIPPGDSIPNDVAMGGAIAAVDRQRLEHERQEHAAARHRAERGACMGGRAGDLLSACGFRGCISARRMRANDSVTDNRSRFYAEIERLRDIVNLSRAGSPTLFLLDELLSGTNSHDRRIGAEALVRGLVERGAIGLVTTHDLALAQDRGHAGRRAPRNVHFEDHLEGGEIRFDYRLRQGVVTRSNALELMRAVGLDV